VRRDPAALQGFQAAGGSSRITSLLQWAALTFGDTVDGAAQSLDSAAQSGQQAARSIELTASAASAARPHTKSDEAGHAAAAASQPAAAAPATDARAPGNPFEGPRLPLLPSPMRLPSTSRRLSSGQPPDDVPPSSPLAHPSPTSLHRLDSARVGAVHFCVSHTLLCNAPATTSPTLAMLLVLLMILLCAVMLGCQWHLTKVTDGAYTTISAAC
jgi:hypothetical protein